MKEDTRRRWMNELSLLARGPDYSEFDAVQTGIAGALVEATTTHRASQAFEALMPEIRKAYVAGRRDLWAIVPQEGLDFRLATSGSRAAALAADLGMPLWVVKLRGRIEQAQRRYDQLLGEGGKSAAGVHELKQKSGAESG